MGIRWTEEEYEEFIRKYARDNRAAVSDADLERAAGDAATPKDESKEVHPRYRIGVHHRSRRLADATGRSHKAAVDGIVLGGIFGDDSPDWVTEISETFEKAKVEETIIEVWEVKE